MGGFFPSHFAPVIMASQNAVVSKRVLMFLSSMPNFNQETNVCIQLNEKKGVWFLQWCFHWACYIHTISEQSSKVGCQTVFSFPNRRLIRLVGMRWKLLGGKMQPITAAPPPCRLWWLPAFLFKPRYSLGFDTPGLRTANVSYTGPIRLESNWLVQCWRALTSHCLYLCWEMVWVDRGGLGCKRRWWPRVHPKCILVCVYEAYSVLVPCTEHLLGAAVLLPI